MVHIEKKLESIGVRPTAMRILIYKFMQQKQAAVSILDIEKAFAKADRTTLYRTLKTFLNKGIVHHIEDGTRVSKYAICDLSKGCDVDHNSHLHFHCNICSKTICLKEHKIPNIVLPDDYMPENVNLVISGVCKTCSKSLY